MSPELWNKLQNYRWGWDNKTPEESARTDRANRLLNTIREIDKVNNRRHKLENENAPKDHQPKYKFIFNWLKQSHQVDLITHAIYEEYNDMRDDSYQLLTNEVVQTPNNLELCLAKFSTQSTKTKKSAKSMIKQTFQNYLKKPIATIDFEIDGYEYVIYYYTQSDYPFLLDLASVKNVMQIFNTKQSTYVILNAHDNGHYVTFNPQIYANALMMFNQTEHYPELQKMTETALQKEFQHLIFNNTDSFAKQVMSPNALGSNMSQTQQTSSLYKYEDLSLQINWFNPIQYLKEENLKDIPQKLRDAITAQINQWERRTIMPLLGQQNTAKEHMLKYFREHHNTAHYLSGEPGVGKTYITSAFIHDYLQIHPLHKILVISPTNVIQKWINVLKEYNPETNILRLNKKHQDPTAGINIISNRDLTITDYINNQNFGLVIYDEVHEVQAGRASFEHLQHILPEKGYRPNFIGLTGTIFNQDISNLNELFHLTNPHEITLATCQGLYSDIAKFTNRFWQYVSTTINLGNVNADLSKIEIEQKIMPIKLIPLTKEEAIFYQFTTARNKALSKQGEKIASDLIDFPANDQFITKHVYRTKPTDEFAGDAFTNTLNRFNQNFPYSPDRITRKEDYISAVSLKEMKLTNTQKFNRVKKILNDNPHETALVLLNGSQNLKRLAKALAPASNRQIKVLSPNTKPTKRAQVINEYLNTKDDNILIANANNIKTGIDLNSVNIIIWYQLLPNLSDILQTQRRAHRLNSTQESKVYYLAYQGTEQEKLINQLSTSNTRNASAYGRRSTDALSQLQGILFKKFQ